MRKGLLLSTVLLPLLACSEKVPRAPLPEYSGPRPSQEAQEALNGLRGAAYEDSTGSYVVQSGFAVIQNPATGHGPVVSLAPNLDGAPERWIPVLTDGDAADFYLRVRGEPHPRFAGQTSAIYRNALGLSDAR